MAAVRQNLLFVICGPSGAGKTTVIEQLFERDDRLAFSVSMTTRDRREGEREGVNYYFVTPARFEQAVEQGELLEHATVHGQSYGTPRSELLKAAARGCDLVLDIDVQGAKQVRSSGVPAVFIFISPPDFAVLRERLIGRQTESDAGLQTRLETAEREMLERPWFEYEVINDDLETAVRAVLGIIRAERAKHVA